MGLLAVAFAIRALQQLFCKRSSKQTHMQRPLIARLPSSRPPTLSHNVIGSTRSPPAQPLLAAWHANPAPHLTCASLTRSCTTYLSATLSTSLHLSGAAAHWLCLCL
eukprot:1149351-Pelagomonas_calceolata.AAC.1